MWARGGNDIAKRAILFGSICLIKSGSASTIIFGAILPLILLLCKPKLNLLSYIRMKFVNVSTDQMEKFEGKWVAIDSKKDLIIAVGDTLEEIAPLVSGSVKDKDKIKASAYLVPRKDEGPYVL